MRIAVIGIGGVGGIVSSALKEAEDSLVLVCRGETANVIKEKGLSVSSDVLGDRVINPALVSSDPKEIGIVDAAIICCKTYSIDSIIDSYRDIIGEDTLVVPLQNGVTAAEDIKERLKGAGQVADGYIYCLSNIESPGVIVNRGEMLRIGIGFSDGRKNESAEELVRLLNDGGLTSVYGGAEIKTALWEKYIMMCGNSSAFIYFDCATGGIQESPERLDFLKGVYNELKNVARADGADVRETIPDEYMAAFMKNPPESMSSLYRDIKQGKKDTEFEAIIGGGVRLAEKLGVSVPLMDKVYKKLG